MTLSWLTEQISNLTLPLIVTFLLSLATILYYLFGLKNSRESSPTRKNIPPGSLGLPVIGESWSFVRAQKKNKGNDWIRKRVAAHGSVFKTSLMGCPTVIITGRPGNKFVFTATDEVLSVKQPPSVVRISGKNLFELTGERYKLVKGVMMNFLKPEYLREYIGQMDDLIKAHIFSETKRNDTIVAVPFMKKVTFNITCRLLFGLHDEPTNEALFQDFTQAFKGLWSLPLNLPGTAYHQALQARARIEKRMLPILNNKKRQLSAGMIPGNDDITTCLLSVRDENDEPLSEEDIIDNFVALMIASHDTSAILLSLMIWKLARDPTIYHKVLEEQMGILNEREEGTQGKLVWSEIQKMKYTWRVAQELMRLIPPVFGNFRKAVKDVKFGEYDIPKGWQVFWECSGTHMDMDIFEDPMMFDPSRFENIMKPIPPFCYVPFGAGPRMCIGNEFARVEVLTVIHNLITRFEWSQLCPDEKITRQPMPYPSKGLPIKIKPRKSS